MAMTEAPEQGTDLVESMEGIAASLRVSYRERALPTWALIQEASEALALAADEITRLRLAAPVWRDISTAPKDGTIIWAANRGSLCVAYWAGKNEKCWRNWYKGCRYSDHDRGIDAYLPDPLWFTPTHWQPLPSPPSEQAADVAIGEQVRSGEAASEHPISPPEGLARE